MKVTVKTIDAQSIQLDVEPDLTVNELKIAILEKLDAVGKQIRLIWRGKVLNDDKKLSEYASDELMLHLVYRPPPREDGTNEGAEPDGATPPPPPRVIDHTHEVMFVQGDSADIPASITEITQGLVDRVLGSLNAQGARGTVTATASSIDSTGRRETAQVSASTREAKPTLPIADPTPPTPSQPPPQPPPAAEATQTAEATPPAEATQTAEATPPADPPPTEEEDKEKEAREQREMIQEYKTQKNIRSHVKDAYRTLQHADRVLLRYKKASARADGQTVDPDEDIETIHDVNRVLAYNNGTTSASIYVTLLNYQEDLFARARPLTRHMTDTIQRSQPHQELEAWKEAQIAQTVREFNYYMGHAAVSLSRLHVNMFAPPPRVIVSTPPKTTEMRGIMSQMRSMHAAPRPPSGYVIEITHNDESGQERTTRARLDTGGRPGGLFGGLGGGGGGGMGLGGMGMGLGGMGMGMGMGGGLAELLRQRVERDEQEEEEKKETDTGTEGAKPMETEPSMPSTSKNGSKRESEEEHMDTSTPPAKKPSIDPDESQPKPTAATSGSTSDPSAASGGGADKSEPAKSEGGDDKEGVATEDEEGVATEGEERELTQIEKDISEYLARLVAHIVAGTPMLPPSMRGEAGEASGGDKKEENDEKELTFAQRFAGPPGTKVKIRQPPQRPMFPGMAPMEGPSITIDNPGDGAEPEMNVDFPMPPALQFLRNLLTRDSDSDSEDEDGDKKEGKDDEKGEAGASNVEGSKSTAAEGSKSDDEGSMSTDKDEDRPLFGRKKTPRKPDEEPPSRELWGVDRDEVESLSDAGSMDSLDSDHEIPPIHPPVIAPATGAQAEAGAVVRESMLHTFTQLRQRYVGASTQAETVEDDMGMVEKLLQDISKELSVLEVMSVFNGATAPLERLQPLLREFLREKLLFGSLPDIGKEETAVKNFTQGCLSSLRAVEDQLPLRDAGIDFPMTIYRLFSSQFRAAYLLIIRDYPGEGGAVFAQALSHWAKSSSALFGQVLRHCINGEQYFEDLVKMLVNTLFPPTTPPLILNMCNSTIHRQLSRVKGRPSKSPKELDAYIVWKECATPTPNKSYELSQFLADQSEFSSSMPTVFLHNVVPEGIEVTGPPTEPLAGPPAEDPPPGHVPQSWGTAAIRDKKQMDTKRTMPFSDAYLAGMPSKKRKLDMSKPQAVPADTLVGTLVTNATSDLTPLRGRSNEEVRDALLANTQGLADAIREDIQRGVARRLLEDTHFIREKYPKSCEYFQLPPT
ncbi:uncharacterized protein LOC135342588 isoform X2 [Halichondria panicea]|uniref:uncharacterized protein LOC135342588 isoform X2 n=1 Tax=Halichondria panicea TaxID=6063 RepID=UPI00312B8D9E